jgi:uncharacterized protein YukE
MNWSGDSKEKFQVERERLPHYVVDMADVSSHLSNNTPRYVSSARSNNCRKIPQSIHNTVASIVTPRHIAI